ncbi:OCIA domain-containing protein 2 [Neosynchiropus ocellatus]
MSAGKTEQSEVKEEAAAAAAAGKKGEWKCPLGDRHIHRDEMRKVWKECQEESFWYRALPLSLGSMAITGLLINQGTLTSSKRFGPFPKLAVAGVVGYLVGKASYMRTCRSKFETLGFEGRPPVGPWSEGGPFNWKGSGPRGPGRRHCHHVCEECKKAPATPAEDIKS